MNLITQGQNILGNNFQNFKYKQMNLNMPLGMYEPRREKVNVED